MVVNYDENEILDFDCDAGIDSYCFRLFCSGAQQQNDDHTYSRI